MFAVYLVLEVCMCTHRFFFFSYVCIISKILRFQEEGERERKKKEKLYMIYSFVINNHHCLFSKFLTFIIRIPCHLEILIESIMLI